LKLETFDNKLWVGGELISMILDRCSWILDLFPNPILVDGLNKYMHYYYSLLKDYQSFGVGELIIHILLAILSFISPPFKSLKNNTYFMGFSGRNKYTRIWTKLINPTWMSYICNA